MGDVFEFPGTEPEGEEIEELDDLMGEVREHLAHKVEAESDALDESLTSLLEKLEGDTDIPLVAQSLLYAEADPEEQGGRWLTCSAGHILGIIAGLSYVTFLRVGKQIKCLVCGELLPVPEFTQEDRDALKRQIQTQRDHLRAERSDGGDDRGDVS